MWKLVTIFLILATTTYSLELAERITYYAIEDSLCDFYKGNPSPAEISITGYKDYIASSIFFKTKGYKVFSLYPFINWEIISFHPNPLAMGKAFRCYYDSLEQSKKLLSYQYLSTIVDFGRTIRTNRTTGQWQLVVPYILGFGEAMGSLEFRRKDWTTHRLQKLDSLANACKTRKEVKEIINLSNSDLVKFLNYYKTNANGQYRMNFLINFTNRLDADSLGYLYYDSTGFSDFTKADSTFPGGIVMNRIFYSDVEPWRVVKGLRYRVTDDLKVEILTEKIFLLFQRYYYEGEICCGG